MSNQWEHAEHALAYLSRADSIPHRTEGEAALLEEVPRTARRVLDLGSGDGRLLSLVLPPEEEDPSNKLLNVRRQLDWLREIGFEDVDCYWKWRELALLVGRRLAGASAG